LKRVSTLRQVSLLTDGPRPKVWVLDHGDDGEGPEVRITDAYLLGWQYFDDEEGGEDVSPLTYPIPYGHGAKAIQLPDGSIEIDSYAQGVRFKTIEAAARAFDEGVRRFHREHNRDHPLLATESQSGKH
jgi:hypothetical protein